MQCEGLIWCYGSKKGFINFEIIEEKWDMYFDLKFDGAIDGDSPKVRKLYLDTLSYEPYWPTMDKKLGIINFELFDCESDSVMDYCTFYTSPEAQKPYLDHYMALTDPLNRPKIEFNNEKNLPNKLRVVWNVNYLWNETQYYHKKTFSSF